MEHKTNENKAALWITLAVCAAAGVAAALIFKDSAAGIYNAGLAAIGFIWSCANWAAIGLLASGLVFPILSVLLSRIDGGLRRLPLGELIKSRFDWTFFERSPARRFLPALFGILFLAADGFIRGADEPAEWLLWARIILFGAMIFAAALIIAEGFVSAGIFGAVIHVPVILLGNVMICVAAGVIAFVVSTIFAWIAQGIMFLIAAFFLSAAAVFGKITSK